MLNLNPIQNKKNALYLILCGIFLTNALIAEIIGVKIFSAETLLGLQAANIKLLDGFRLDFNLTAGVIIWPFVFITTDLINEYFGKEGVRKISYLSAILICYAFLIIWIVTLLPPADFWLDLNTKDNGGNYFNINFAFSKIFRQGLGIIVGSIAAFLISQILDMYVFQFIKKTTGNKMLWLRATASTIISQLIDSFIVLFIAFYLFDNWSMALVLSVATINYIYKFTVAVLLTPILYLAHHWIDKYLGLTGEETSPER